MNKFTMLQSINSALNSDEAHANVRVYHDVPSASFFTYYRFSTTDITELVMHARSLNCACSGSGAQVRVGGAWHYTTPAYTIRD